MTLYIQEFSCVPCRRARYAGDSLQSAVTTVTPDVPILRLGIAGHQAAVHLDLIGLVSHDTVAPLAKHTEDLTPCERLLFCGPEGGAVLHIVPDPVCALCNYSSATGRTGKQRAQ